MATFTTIKVHGDVTFGRPGVRAHTLGTVEIPSSLNEELSKLQAQIDDLTARVVALESKITP
jgi:hypothetical protein